MKKQNSTITKKKHSSEVKRPKIPYRAGNPIIDPKGFFGREDIFHEVMRMLHNPHENAIVLYGQRRIGKTSVLLQLQRRLADEGEFTPVYFDLQDKASQPLGEMLYQLAQEIASETKQLPLDRNHFDDDGNYFRRNFLPTAAEKIATGGLVLLFDEFDVLEDYQEKSEKQAGNELVPYLRQWMADLKQVKLCYVCGRRPEDLLRDIGSIFKMLRPIPISLLKKKDCEAIVRQSEKDGSLFWNEASVEKVWEWTQGHPYLTQLLCSVVWERTYDIEHTTTPQVEPRDVDAVIDEVLKQGDFAFNWIWGGLPSAEKVAMAAMAEAGDKIITQEIFHEILKRSGLPLILPELNIAPETLIKWELLRKDEKGFRFAVRLLCSWVAKNKPLSMVKPELDRIDARAEELFKPAQMLYNSKNFAEAEILLRKVRENNPNHLGAMILLGNILLDTNRIDQAVEIFEQGYKWDQPASEVYLIKALLTMADRNPEESEQLKIYERVLKIDPNQNIARQQKSKIWISRGDQASKQEKWDEAISAYQEAGDKTKIKQAQESKHLHEFEEFYNQVEQHEKNKDWQSAIKIWKILIKDFKDQGDFRPRLEQAESQASLEQRYSDALQALDQDNVESAKELLIGILAEKPNKEFLRYLVQAFYGKDFDIVKRKEYKFNFTKFFTPFRMLIQVIGSFFKKVSTLKVWQQLTKSAKQQKLFKHPANWLISSLIWLPLLGWALWYWRSSILELAANINFWLLIFFSFAWIVTALVAHIGELPKQLLSFNLRGKPIQIPEWVFLVTLPALMIIISIIIARGLPALLFIILLGMTIAIILAWKRTGIVTIIIALVVGISAAIFIRFSMDSSARKFGLTPYVKSKNAVAQLFIRKALASYGISEILTLSDSLKSAIEVEHRNNATDYALALSDCDSINFLWDHERFLKIFDDSLMIKLIEQLHFEDEYISVGTATFLSIIPDVRLPDLASQAYDSAKDIRTKRACRFILYGIKTFMDSSLQVDIISWLEDTEKFPENVKPIRPKYAINLQPDIRPDSVMKALSDLFLKFETSSDSIIKISCLIRVDGLARIYNEKLNDKIEAWLRQKKSTGLPDVDMKLNEIGSKYGIIIPTQSLANSLKEAVSTRDIDKVAGYSRMLLGTQYSRNLSTLRKPNDIFDDNFFKNAVALFHNGNESASDVLSKFLAQLRDPRVLDSIFNDYDEFSVEEKPKLRCLDVLEGFTNANKEYQCEIKTWLGVMEPFEKVPSVNKKMKNLFKMFRPVKISHYNKLTDRIDKLKMSLYSLNEEEIIKSNNFLIAIADSLLGLVDAEGLPKIKADDIFIKWGLFNDINYYEKVLILVKNENEYIRRSAALFFSRLQTSNRKLRAEVENLYKNLDDIKTREARETIRLYLVILAGITPNSEERGRIISRWTNETN